MARKKTSIYVDENLWAEVQKACIDRRSGVSEALEEMFREWLSPARSDEVTVTAPRQLREMVNGLLILYSLPESSDPNVRAVKKFLADLLKEHAKLGKESPQETAETTPKRGESVS